MGGGSPRSGEGGGTLRNALTESPSRNKKPALERSHRMSRRGWIALSLFGATSWTACAPHAANVPPIDAAKGAFTEAGGEAAAAASPVSPATDAGLAASDDLMWLDRHAPAEPASSRGPIRITGYTRVVSTGMNDPAHVVGFTRDGSQFGYCARSGGIDPQVLSCEFVDHDGHTVRTSDYGSNADFHPDRHAEMIRWLSDAGVPVLANGKDGLPIGPELKGDWDFAGSITLAVIENGSGPSGAFVRLGGSVDGEAPVSTYTWSLHHDTAPYHTAWVNGLVLSPDGSEIGLVAGFFCMEWCDDFVVQRLSTRTLASRIFNDTGMRHHTKGEYTASARLFARAVQADRTRPLAAYNLACALARLGDADAERALAYAIHLGGEPVRQRAMKDEDLRGVRAPTAAAP
jgi:hypothetical protein